MMVRLAVMLLNIPIRLSEYIPGVASPDVNWCCGIGTAHAHESRAGIENPKVSFSPPGPLMCRPCVVETAPDLPAPTLHTLQ